MPLAIFNGSHTIRNRQTQEHRTFRIRTILHGDLKGKRTLALLTGPDNTSNYKSFAFVNDDGTISVWHKYRGVGHWEGYAKMISKIIIERDPWWTERYEHMLEGRCCRCNRLLTHPESLETGIGPECRKRG